MSNLALASAVEAQSQIRTLIETYKNGGADTEPEALAIAEQWAIEVERIKKAYALIRAEVAAQNDDDRASLSPSAVPRISRDLSPGISSKNE